MSFTFTLLLIYAILCIFRLTMHLDLDIKMDELSEKANTRLSFIISEIIILSVSYGATSLIFWLGVN